VSSEVFWGLVGLVTSLVTFWLGYRQTVGARRERVRAANAEIEQLALKRMILEDWRPSYEEVTRFIAGVGASMDVSAAGLRKPEDLGNLLMARALQNDLISQDKRKAILESALPITRPSDDDEGAPAGTAGDNRNRRTVVVNLVLVLLAVAMGVAVNLIPNLRSQDFNLWDTLPFVIGATALVGTLAIYLGYKPSNSELPFIGPSEETREQADELRSYPSDKEISAALNAIEELSPFAVASLAVMLRQEHRLLRSGAVPGGFLRRGGTPWHRELATKGLIVSVQPPPGIEAKGREFVTLTSRGQIIGRVLQANKPVPPAIVDWLDRRAANRERGEGSDGIPRQPVP
jgi:hypothetical protein